MHKLFVYDNGPIGPRLFTRPALRALAAAGDCELLVAAGSDEAVLFADLAGPRLRVVASPFPGTPLGAAVDLRTWCPRDHLAVDFAFASFEDTHTLQWESVVKVVSRRLRAAGVPCALEYDRAAVPMLDFDHDVAVPRAPGPAVYLDTVRGIDRHCHFVFDLPRLLAALPEYTFCCTDPAGFTHERLLDISALDLVQRSRFSEQCALLVGVGAMPFHVVLTEPNRQRPKAVCGYEPTSYPTFWDHPDSRLAYLENMDDLVGFLLAQARRLALPCRRLPAAGAC